MDGYIEYSKTSSTPTPFQFEGRNVRCVAVDGETWFVATDVARELGYGLATDLTRHLDADEKGMYAVHTLGGEQDLAIISEPGLYRAIIQRRANKKHDTALSEKVARFQRFVFHDVLPSIARTGSYVSAPTVPAFAIPKTYAEALRLAADQHEQIERQQAEIVTLAPKAEFFERFINSDGLYNYQNAARALGCHPNLFTRWLKRDYLFYAHDSLVPYVRHTQAGLFQVKNAICGDGKSRPQGFITPKGLEYFSSRIPAEIKIGETVDA